jgi:hypothetical protein
MFLWKGSGDRASPACHSLQFETKDLHFSGLIGFQPCDLVIPTTRLCDVGPLEAPLQVRVREVGSVRAALGVHLYVTDRPDLLNAERSLSVHHKHSILRSQRWRRNYQQSVYDFRIAYVFCITSILRDSWGQPRPLHQVLIPSQTQRKTARPYTDMINVGGWTEQEIKDEAAKQYVYFLFFV